MKKVIYENIYNKERFLGLGRQETKFIDGIEYIKLLKEGTQRELFIRKDFLKKVNI